MFLRIFTLLLIISLSRISISKMWWEIDPDDAYFVSVYGYSKPEIKDVQVNGNARIVCGKKGESEYSFKNSDPFRVGKYLYDGNFPYNCFVEVDYKLRRNLRDVCKSELEDKEKNKKKGNIHCKFGVFETKQIKKNRLSRKRKLIRFLMREKLLN